MADIMKLNSVETQDITSLIQAESRRRTWWTLYLADNWCVSGLGMLSPTSHGVIAIDLPMDEADFQALHVDEQVPSRNGPCHTGSFAQIVLLSRLFSPIQDLNRQVAAQDSARGTNLDHEVEVLSQKLEEWTGQLPPDMGMSWENLHQHQERGSGGSFVVMHLAYHYYGTLLYFRFLEDHKHHRPGSTSLPETTHGATAITLMYGSTYVHRCRSHASQFSTLLRRARQLRGCEPMFPLVGHMTTVSSAVLLYTLLFSHEEHKLGRARDELQANFEALVELKRYWPATAAMITRLVRFQETCLLWSEEEEEGGGLAGTHRLDGWMLRFLLERSLAGEGGSS